ncbi:O-fucosyltransferase 15-like isoform X4 [Coffea eugenioides]|uniref:O-fucosyltransferase 15-like isoform X4 n=1 Tax=Coffea eugenioides TaxID=49369 RepID=UPI000F60F387|nr:O-fucosyltransferase 15-like isoform X4 [Coffea eugenioides]
MFRSSNNDDFSGSSDLNEEDMIKDPQPDASTSGNLRKSVSQSTSSLTSNGSVESISATRFSHGSRRKSKRWRGWCQRRGIAGLALLVLVFFIFNSWMLYRIRDPGRAAGIKVKYLKMNSSTVSIKICNAVAVARLLNATLVLPGLMYSSVWRDASQFGNIYQEDHFINYLKPDVRIVKELPKQLKSLDLDAIGSVVSDADIVKEAKPGFYKKYILPILHLNRVVHFVGFGNRLASDPIPFKVQRLRCRCNFHALRFVPKIQETGALLIQRMRQNMSRLGPLDKHLLGPLAEPKKKGQRSHSTKASRYLALHLRFEIDMVAHSLCEFGGGKEEQKELEAYREKHFPALIELKKTQKLPSTAALREEGLCPLMPEETVLMLAALGFNRKTRIYLAGAHIYGGKSRLTALTTLFPNLVTKENLLSSAEIEPFANFSSQLAALDFITCTAADNFAMTDSGSQFSSLVSGYRIYYGGGEMPTIRPNKRRLADIFVKNNTIEWSVFEKRVRKAVRQTKRVFSRPTGRSVYRYPRCPECMCSDQP